VLWLEDYLTKYTKTLIVVSHDRKFLDNVCTDVMYAREEKKIRGESETNRIPGEKKNRNFYVFVCVFSR
jgi:ATPase subunit of ABC transporter with duplicated ATPase domains